MKQKRVRSIAEHHTRAEKQKRNKMDPREVANRYLEANKINEIFQELGTRLMFERPSDPNAFMVRELQKMQQAKQSATAVITIERSM